MAHTICSFQRATEQSLWCERTRVRWFQQSRIEFDRQSVWRVRLEHSDDHNRLLGAEVGEVPGL